MMTALYITQIACVASIIKVSLFWELMLDQQFLFLFIIAIITGCDSNQIEIGQNDFAIQKVNIVDVKTGELHENRTVIISGNKIKTIIQISNNIKTTRFNTIQR